VTPLSASRPAQAAATGTSDRQDGPAGGCPSRTTTGHDRGARSSRVRLAVPTGCPRSGVDIEPRPARLPALAPTVPPPRPFVERRVASRRAEDRDAHREKVLLARSLDILASDVDAEARLAGLLRLLAATAGARRVAVMADGVERRAAVAIEPGDDPAEGEALASWLDAHAPRSRARRAATGRAAISFIVAASDPTRNGAFEAGTELDAAPVGPDHEPRSVAEPGDPHYASLAIPSAGDVVLGFEFARAADAERLADRLPPSLARHAAVALSLVTGQLANERELSALRARDSERTTFVSTVAHELRTPLTGLRGYLELILAGQVADPAIEREFLERSRSIVDSLGDLVGDLLEVARLESGSVELDRLPFSVGEVGANVASGLLPIALERDVRLTTSLPPRLRMATGDRRRVEQILVNLTANALKFTPSGGNVEIEGRLAGAVAVLVVRDDGAGIGSEDRARIFERFHRMAGHERITGTGLGLPIARDLARRMDGDLDVASVPGAGSAFILVLPGLTEVPDGGVAAALRAALEAEEQGFGERVLRRRMAQLDAHRPAGPGAGGRPTPIRRVAGPRGDDAVTVLASRRSGGSPRPA
jgi:signal transduction histidine kinase